MRIRAGNFNSPAHQRRFGRRYDCKHDTDVVQPEFSAQTLEDIDRNLRDARVFHIDADKVPSPVRVFNHAARIAVSEFRIET